MSDLTTKKFVEYIHTKSALEMKRMAFTKGHTVDTVPGAVIVVDAAANVEVEVSIKKLLENASVPGQRWHVFPRGLASFFMFKHVQPSQNGYVELKSDSVEFIQAAKLLPYAIGVAQNKVLAEMAHGWDVGSIERFERYVMNAKVSPLGFVVFYGYQKSAPPLVFDVVRDEHGNGSLKERASSDTDGEMPLDAGIQLIRVQKKKLVSALKLLKEFRIAIDRGEDVKDFFDSNGDLKSPSNSGTLKLLEEFRTDIDLDEDPEDFLDSGGDLKSPSNLHRVFQYAIAGSRYISITEGLEEHLDLFAKMKPAECFIWDLVRKLAPNGKGSEAKKIKSLREQMFQQFAIVPPDSVWGAVTVGDGYKIEWELNDINENSGGTLALNIITPHAQKAVEVALKGIPRETSRSQAKKILQEANDATKIEVSTDTMSANRVGDPIDSFNGSGYENGLMSVSGRMFLKVTAIAAMEKYLLTNGLVADVERLVLSGIVGAHKRLLPAKKAPLTPNTTADMSSDAEIEKRRRQFNDFVKCMRDMLEKLRPKYPASVKKVFAAKVGKGHLRVEINIRIAKGELLTQGGGTREIAFNYIPPGVSPSTWEPLTHAETKANKIIDGDAILAPSCLKRHAVRQVLLGLTSDEEGKIMDAFIRAIEEVKSVEVQDEEAADVLKEAFPEYAMEYHLSRIGAAPGL